MNTTLFCTFGNAVVDYSIQEDINSWNIAVYGKYNHILHYQTYVLAREYCGDISFKPVKNEFRGEKMFTNAELKSLFGVENVYPNIDNYHLDNLFNLAF